MKKLIKNILFLVLATVLLMYALDSVYSYIYRNGIPRNKVAYVLSKQNKKIDYVFIGSSRVDNTIVPNIITEITGKSSINLGMQGAKPDDYYLMLQLLHKQKIVSDTVFIQIDYTFNMGGTSDIINSSLMPYINDSLISAFIKERNPDFYKLKYIPFYRYLIFDYKLGFREAFSTAIGKPPNLDLESGYFPKYGFQGGKLASTLPESINEENSTLNKINIFAKANDISIVYFMAPYCANTTNLDFSDKLVVKIPSMLNFTRVFIEEDDNFFNCSHLNDKGAKEFSKIFAEAISNN